MYQPRLTTTVFLFSLLLGLSAFHGSTSLVYAVDDKEAAAEPATPKAVSTNGEAVSSTPEVKTSQSPLPPAIKAAPSKYKVVGQADQSAAPKISTLGELGGIGGEHPYKLHAEISGYGGSLWHISLSEYTADVVPDKPELTTDEDKKKYRKSTAYTIQKARDVGGGSYVFPYRPVSITLNKEVIDLQSASHSRWLKEAEGVYSITIFDQSVKPNKPVLKITRKYTLDKGTYLLNCYQSFINLSGEPLEFSWKQNGAHELPEGRSSYIGDKREAVAGYFNSHYQQIRTDGAFLNRRHLTDPEDRAKVFHGNEDIPEGADLKWLAFTNRYFAVATTRVKNKEAKKAAEVVPSLSEIFPQTSCAPVKYINEDPEKPVLGYYLTSAAITLKAGEAKQLDYAIFMGGRNPTTFKNPNYSGYGFDSLVVYTMGGPCTFCTFQWLAKGLLSTLRLFNQLTGDWGIAIILLVLCVRLCLHPITKKSQINMAKLGKQMQALQPELEKLKKKYPDDKDKHKLSQEMMQLYREKGVNPANFLGCLPMFLQMPIWIALYAMLYFAIELRHEPGFYGIFQLIGHSSFLADLAMPDRLIVFYSDPKVFDLGLIKFDYSSFNILPIFMGIFWFYNQKLQTPKASTPEQATQQKMMRYMMLTFPFFMYSAPSGLTLYIMASSIAGVADSLIVKRHIKKEEEAGTLFDKKEKKPPKPGGLRHRLGVMMEAKRAELEQRMQEQQQEQNTGKQPGMNRSMQRSMQARNRNKGKQKRKK